MKLFINCKPEYGPSMRLEEWLERTEMYEAAKQFMRRELDVSDPPEYWNAAPFGKGPKALGAVVEGYALEQGIDDVKIVVNTDLPAANELLPTLRREADQIVSRL